MDPKPKLIECGACGGRGRCMRCGGAGEIKPDGLTILCEACLAMANAGRARAVARSGRRLSAGDDVATMRRAVCA